MVKSNFCDSLLKVLIKSFLFVIHANLNIYLKMNLYTVIGHLRNAFQMSNSLLFRAILTYFPPLYYLYFSELDLLCGSAQV